MKAMDDLASQLPTTPRRGMLAAALADNIDSDLGGELLIYARESYYPDDDIPEEWGGQPYNTRGRWGARCTCTACNETFWAGWLKGGGITMTVGEDGNPYSGIPDKDTDYAVNVVCWPDGDNTSCPLCGSSLTLVHRKHLRSGRTYQLMVGSIERVDDLADFGYRKPRDMMRFTRQEIAECRAWNWTADTAALWMEGVYFGLWSTGAATEFERLRKKYGEQNISRYVGDVTDGYDFEPLDKWDAYLDKQHEKHALPSIAGFEMLIDYRKELEELVDEPGADELWPRDLRAAHDRLFAAKKLKEDASSIANFEAIAQKWAALEWSDGEICIRLPRCNNDLVAEGHTLHHCVGGYGKTHLQGKLVLFVRHARRPERSWYTLNIDTTGTRPKRIQLHGYGNEWSNGKKLAIPQRVLDFCNRWESEILAKVFDAVRAEETKQQKKKGAA